MNFETLAQCIRSGQLSAQQVVTHMADQTFAAWYRKTYP